MNPATSSYPRLWIRCILGHLVSSVTSKKERLERKKVGIPQKRGVPTNDASMDAECRREVRG